MDIKSAVQIMEKCIVAGLPVLLVGAPGVGKSDLVEQAAYNLGYDTILSHPVVAEPTEAKGLPFPSEDKTHATFLPYGDLARALSATKKTIWFLDDLGQANPAVQAAFMQLLLARRIGEHKLPDCVTFVAATNRKSDRAGVSGILEPVKSRFACILEVAPTLDDWVTWAFGNGIPGELIAFLRYRPNLLMDNAPTAEIVNRPCPRTWARLGQMLTLGFEGDELLLHAAAGAVGMGAATEFVGFMKVWRELTSPDAILATPEKAKIPTNPSSLYATVAALAYRATPENISRIIKFGARMIDAGQGEFATLLLRDAIRRCPKAAETTAYVQAISGPFAQSFA